MRVHTLHEDIIYIIYVWSIDFVYMCICAYMSVHICMCVYVCDCMCMTLCICWQLAMPKFYRQIAGYILIRLAIIVWYNEGLITIGIVLQSIILSDSSLCSHSRA